MEEKPEEVHTHLSLLKDQKHSTLKQANLTQGINTDSKAFILIY